MTPTTSAPSQATVAAMRRFGIIGSDPTLLHAIDRAVRVGPVDLSVLVAGESGTGKESIPRIIHAHSPRKHARYIAVNCAAIPEGTIDSELFGHERGSFTGAVAERRGYFEEANGGTIFLDEVAELPLTTQARLLRVLETGEYLRVGSSEVRRTDIRIVAATNVRLLEAVSQGRFREDLYYRLSTVTITLPPLRQRGNDIILLTRKFAADFAERYHTPPLTLSPEAQHLLLTYPWPGNIRQLKNVIEQAALFDAPAGPLTSESLMPLLNPAPDAGSCASRLNSPSDPSVPTSDRPSAPLASTAHSYTAERDVIFSAIATLFHRLDSLTQTAFPAEQVTTPTRLLLPRLNHADMIDPVDSGQYGPAAPGHSGSSGLSDISVPSDMSAPSDMSGLSFTIGVPTPQSSPVITDTVATDVATDTPATSPRTIADAERLAIADALRRNDGRRRDTARELGLSERTLYRKIRQYHLA